LPPFVPPGYMPGMLPLKPCLPTRAPAHPAGPDWLHEIKHDGCRMLARRDGERGWGGRKGIPEQPAAESLEWTRNASSNWPRTTTP
jgi:hypothetical protein